MIDSKLCFVLSSLMNRIEITVASRWAARYFDGCFEICHATHIQIKSSATMQAGARTKLELRYDHAMMAILTVILMVKW